MARLPSSLVAAIVMTLACMAWIGGVSYALVYFLGLSSLVGWIIVGAMSLVAVLVVGIFLFELRHAVDLTDCDSPPEFENRPVPAPRKAVSAVHAPQSMSAQALRVSNEPL